MLTKCHLNASLLRVLNTTSHLKDNTFLMASWVGEGQRVFYFILFYYYLIFKKLIPHVG